MKRFSIILVTLVAVAFIMVGLLGAQLWQLNGAPDGALSASQWLGLKGQLSWAAAAEFALCSLLFVAGLSAGILYFREQACLRTAAKSVLALANADSEQPADLSYAAAILFACKRLELMIAESRRKEKFLIERAIDVVCVVNGEARITSVSKACKRAWGYEPAELQGQSLHVILSDSSPDELIRKMVGTAKSIDRVVFESRLLCKDGTLLDVMWTGHWSASESGLFCIVTDISQQKQVEKQIRESEQNVRSTLESLPIGVMTVDAANKIEFANTTSHTMLGWQPGELADKRAVEIFPDERLQRPAVALHDLEIETCARTRDGIEIPVEVRVSQIELAGQSKELIAFMDLSDAREVERLKRHFVAMVTHDLKSPIQSVRGLLTLLEEGVVGNISPEGIKIATGARRGCDLMMRLLNDMLEMEKIDSGTFDLVCRAANVRDTIMQALETTRPSLQEKRLDFDTTLEDVVCNFDEQRLLQVMNNLLTNAIRYSPENSRINVTLCAAPAYALVQVKDTGPGIPANKTARVFDKFQQADTGDARARGGTGLGLSICKAIIEQHGGTIGVDSTIGKGSTFWFTLPRQDKTGAEE